MYPIGLDLAVQAAHKAVVTDEQGSFITPILTLRTRPGELDQLLVRARDGKQEAALRVVMEPTGMAWFPIAVYLIRHDVTGYLVNSQEVADLRRYYKRHAKSDRIDARVLASLPLVNPAKLHRLHLPTARALACQRSCKQLDRFAWPGLEDRVFADPFALPARWMRTHWYDPCGKFTRAAIWKRSKVWAKAVPRPTPVSLGRRSASVQRACSEGGAAWCLIVRRVLTARRKACLSRRLVLI